MAIYGPRDMYQAVARHAFPDLSLLEIDRDYTTSYVSHWEVYCTAYVGSSN